MGVESKIEATVAEYAESLGCLHLKLLMLTTMGWPDRLFLYMGRVLFIEFKQPGERPAKIQLWIHGKLRKHLFKVEVVDNVSQGKVYIDELVHSNDSLDRNVP